MIQLYGLPEETLERHRAFEQHSVSVFREGFITPVVTLIWLERFNLPDKKPLASVLSIEYNDHISNHYKRDHWLYEYLTRHGGHKRPMQIRGRSDDPLTVLALAFDQAETLKQLQKGTTHDQRITLSTGTGPRTPGLTIRPAS